MSTDVWIYDAPHLARPDYQTYYPSPCALYEEDYRWYRGTGIRPEEHPLGLNFEGCAACQSQDVLVLAAQYNCHPYNGDEYWDYELVCQACGKFTQRSYAENG